MERKVQVWTAPAASQEPKERMRSPAQLPIPASLAVDPQMALPLSQLVQRPRMTKLRRMQTKLPRMQTKLRRMQTKLPRMQTKLRWMQWKS